MYQISLGQPVTSESQAILQEDLGCVKKTQAPTGRESGWPKVAQLSSKNSNDVNSLRHVMIHDNIKEKKQQLVGHCWRTLVIQFTIWKISK